MFLAILVPRSQDQFIEDHIIDKVTVFLPTKKYTICLVSENNVPSLVLNSLVRISVFTGIEIPVNAYQHYHSQISNIIDPHINRHLMALRSKLSYTLSETLAPDRLYFQLELPMNEESTRRAYNYNLYYDEIPCYSFTADDFLQTLTTATQLTLGPLILSTSTFNLNDIPHWYVKEIIRDIISLGELDMTDKIMVEGELTSELYLFYQRPVNVTEDTLNDLIVEIRGRILTSIQLRIFPRNTPSKTVHNRRLRLMDNGQWTLDYAVPSDVNIFKTTLQQCFTFKALDELFWFLVWLLLLPTYFYVIKEIRISTKPHEIKVCQSTQYLPDYIRVKTLSRLKIDAGAVKIIYPSKLSAAELSELLVDQTYVRFYDYGNNETAILLHPKIDMPSFDKVMPSEYTLSKRIADDVNL